jgi:hypothetical protein
MTNTTYTTKIIRDAKSLSAYKMIESLQDSFIPNWDFADFEFTTTQFNIKLEIFFSSENLTDSDWERINNWVYSIKNGRFYIQGDYIYGYVAQADEPDMD